MLRAWAADATPILSRPISVDDFDNQTGALTFLYQVKGEGTHKLAALKKDDTLTVTGPCGNGFDTAALAHSGQFVVDEMLYTGVLQADGIHQARRRLVEALTLVAGLAVQGQPLAGDAAQYA